MWTDEATVKSGALGMYERFRNLYNDDNFFIYFEFRSGFWKTGTSGAAQWNDLFFNTPSAGSTPGLDWSSFYQLINQANLVLKYAPQVRFSNVDTQSTVLAEAYFMRAYAYYSLVRIWGEVPVSTSPFESDSDENLFPSRKPVSEVFAVIKADIDSALVKMKDKTHRNRVMVSESAINMLKADVYLWSAKVLNGGENDFIKAKEAALAVYQDTKYKLLPGYESVFRVEQNEEIIFSIYFDQLENTDQYGKKLMLDTKTVPASLQNNPIPISSNAQWYTVTDHYIDTYLTKTSGDSRTNVIWKDYNDGSKTYRWVNKFLGEWISDTRMHTSDTRIYRYAEAVLFLAEALNGLNETQEAIKKLNEVAFRAYGVTDFYPSTLSKEQVDENILTERLIEFGAEGKSWFDFIRFGKAFDLIPTLKNRQNDYQGNILYLPVSLNTITKNINIKQTPGYE